jgi:hypothetical protein
LASIVYASLVRTKSRGYVKITAVAPELDPASRSTTGDTLCGRTEDREVASLEPVESLK